MADGPITLRDVAAIAPALGVLDALTPPLMGAALSLVSQGLVTPPATSTPTFGPLGWGIPLVGSRGQALFLGLYLGGESIVAAIPDLYLRIDPPAGSPPAPEAAALLQQLCAQLTDPALGIYWGFDTDGSGALWTILSLGDVARSPDPADTCRRFFDHGLGAIERLELLDLLLGAPPPAPSGDSP